MEWNELHARVWRGNLAAAFTRAVIPTGFHELDRVLPGGGWPLGAVTEVFVDRYGIGELELLMPALAVLTKENPAIPKKWVAWVAPPFVPYAPALQQRGVNTDRLLMIHPTPGDKSRLWAIEQAVRSGSSAGVLAWLTTAGTGTAVRSSATSRVITDDVTLRRLQLAAEDQGCWVLLFRPVGARHARSPAALRIRVTQASTGARVEIIKCRGGRPGVVDVTGLAIDGTVSAQAPHP